MSDIVFDHVIFSKSGLLGQSGIWHNPLKGRLNNVHSIAVIPAKAGFQSQQPSDSIYIVHHIIRWAPAFAGITRCFSLLMERQHLAGIE